MLLGQGEATNRHYAPLGSPLPRTALETCMLDYADRTHSERLVSRRRARHNTSPTEVSRKLSRD